MQNEWIDDCMSGISGWWTSLTGQLDNCIEGFDTAHPECVNAGYGAEEAVREVHEAYGAAGEIIGGAFGIIGGIAIDAVHCAAGVVEGVWVLTETGTILITGEDFGDYGISDEALEAAEQACWNTAGNAMVFAGAIVAPELVATAIVGSLGYQGYQCYDACMNHDDPYYCTRTCYEGLGAHSAALLGFLGLGHMMGGILPESMLAPEAFGYDLGTLRPWVPRPASSGEPPVVDPASEGIPVIRPPAEPYGDPIVEYLPPETPVYRVQPPNLEMQPHESTFFDPLDYGYAIRYGQYDALYVGDHAPTLEALRTGQGYFEDGMVMRESTLGELVTPDTIVLEDYKFNLTVVGEGGEGQGIVIIRPKPGSGGGMRTESSGGSAGSGGSTGSGGSGGSGGEPGATGEPPM